MTEKSTFNDAYILMCDSIRQQAEATLERSLSSTELGGIYNAGSLMMLESIDMGFYYKTYTKDNLSEKLSSVATSFHQRFEDVRKSLAKTLEEKYLNQPLGDALIAKINQIPYCYTAYQIFAKLEKTPKAQRYDVLVAYVDDLY